ncbi:hypothetical protein BJP36_41050 [Moorena producens JHB]|uniref:Uncharacterized protein n=1 Tax=Moorena producens (strain JHB) TaxID=1454205 RepID=A0A9Q9SSC2_MOOP1|nr:hypothetical protein [Moorena producens]WAN68755.1 hypothetical protein BJP36_41050 [Moorena producens JHB]
MPKISRSSLPAFQQATRSPSKHMPYTHAARTAVSGQRSAVSPWPWPKATLLEVPSAVSP